MGAENGRFVRVSNISVTIGLPCKRERFKMLFSVIYSFDICRGYSVKRWMPSQRHLFTITEGNESYEFDYLADGDKTDRWYGGKHRKLCALLTKKQFERFISDTWLQAEDVETMGSIGAPGFGFGHAPAISFSRSEDWGFSSAYVTPIPIAKKVKDLETLELVFNERQWERLRKVIIERYS